MKKKSKSVLVTSGIIVLVLALFITGSNFIQQTAVGDTLPQSKYIEAPRFGYLSCSPTDPTTVIKLMTGEFGQASMDNYGTATPYMCSQFLGMTEGCDITFEMINGDLSGTATTALFQWQVLKYGSDFSQDFANTLAGGIGGYDNHEKATVHLNKDDVVYIRYSEGFPLSPKKYNSKVNIIVSGTQFALHIHDELSPINGQIVPDSRLGNCFLESSYYKSREIEYNSPEIVELKDAQKDYALLNKPNGVYTYFSHLEPVPSFDSKVETYQNNNVYCMNNALYKIYQIKANGYTYNVVNYEKSGYLTQVNCCNGDEKPAYICIDHQWVKQELAECDLSAGKFCPQSTYQPYGEIEYKRYVCEDNKCVKDVIEVTCNDKDDCANGEVCVFMSDPKDNYCVEGGNSDIDLPIPINLCEPTWKVGSITVIPNLSSSCISFGTPLKIGLVILAFLLGFGLAYKFFPFDEKKDKAKVGIGIITGAVFAMLTYFYIWILLILAVIIFIAWIVKR